MFFRRIDMKAHKSTLALLASIACAFVSLCAQAQTYPNRPVRIIAALTSGGPGDVATRGASQVLGQVMGQPFVVENRPGADGIIGGEACVKAAPDGHTLCTLDSFGVSLNPVIRAKMPYDTARDLTPVVHLGFLPAGIIVNASVPANSLRELLELAKTKPGAITWGSFGLASSSNLYMEWLKNVRGIAFLNVPYKGASQAWQAVLAGEVQVAVFATGPAVPQMSAGKVKVLAVNTEARFPRLPNVPTFRESGMELAIVTWFGMLAPAGTPREILLRLNSEISKEFINNAALKEKYLSAAGIEVFAPTGGSIEAFNEFLKREQAMYVGAVKAAGVSIE